MGRLSLPTLSNVRSQSTLNIKLVHRGICKSNFDNGVRNGAISILKRGKILVYLWKAFN